MMVVIQPNVITQGRQGRRPNRRMRAVTKTGIERLHTAPRGFIRV